MGLIQPFVSDFGITAPNAYHKVGGVKGYNNGAVGYTIEIYYDLESRLSGKIPLKKIRTNLGPVFSSQLSVIHEIYELLKATPEYSEAQDLFEATTFPYVNYYLTNATLIFCTASGGYNSTFKTLTNGTVEGKVLHNGKIILGTFSNVNASFTKEDGYGNLYAGHVVDGYADGYVVQAII